MKTLRMRLGGRESVVICRKNVFKALRGVLEGSRGLVVTDSNVARIYERAIARNLCGIPVFILPAGEGSKSEEMLFSLLGAMAEENLRRDSVLIALGGGVVGDVGGLAASLYMRGIRCIQVPTTLLAQADSAIGGKTAIDFCGIKNLVGTFSPPAAVYVDPAFLATLPPREITCGLGEIVKYGALDGEIFEKLCAGSDLRDVNFLADILPDCIAYKAKIVQKDPEERGVRQCLNLGHTTAHALELADGTLSHGACVLVGMLYEARIAARLPGADGEYLARLEVLIRRAADFDFRSVDVLAGAERALSDKKNTEDGAVTLVAPFRKGEYTVLTLPFARYRAALAEIGGAL